MIAKAAFFNKSNKRIFKAFNLVPSLALAQKVEIQKYRATIWGAKYLKEENTLNMLLFLNISFLESIFHRGAEKKILSLGAVIAKGACCQNVPNENTYVFHELTSHPLSSFA